MTIVICGGGIAGLSTALSLKHQGFNCEVFERKEDRRTSTSAINLAPSGVRVLADLGLEQAILEKSQPVRLMRMKTSEGSLLAELPLLGKEQYGHDPLCMTRRVLHNVLTTRCAAEEIPVHYNASLTGFSQTDDGVLVKFSDGSRRQTPLLIGADGIHSSVRHNLFPELTPSERTDRQYFGCGLLVPLAFLSTEEQLDLRLSDGGMSMLAGTLGFVGFIGIGRPEEDGKEKFMMWTHLGKQHAGANFDPNDQKQVKQVLIGLRGDWSPPVKKVLELLDQGDPDVEVVCGPIFSIKPIPRWSAGRVLLIGDAAHGYGPGAQGAALAMEDGQLLAYLLKRVSSDPATLSVEQLGPLLQQFEAKRRPRVEKIGEASETRNDGRLVEKTWLRRWLEEQVALLVGWWYKNGWYEPSYSYTVEEDLWEPFPS